MPKEFLTGSGDWGYDAYFQAVTEGMVDPKIMNLDSFLSKSAHKKIDLSDGTDEYHYEVYNSRMNVKKLFRSEDQRQEIIKKLFGEDYLLNNQ